MKQKPKELESWQIDKGAQEQEEKQGLDFANKIINKFKPKELDWKSRVEFIEGGSDYWIQIDGKAVNSKKDLINYLKPIFTQQRTELLEEIKKIIEKHKKEKDRLEYMSEEELQEEGYESEGEPEYYCIGLGDVIDDLEKLLIYLIRKMNRL
jgi:hypothetical protein